MEPAPLQYGLKGVVKLVRDGGPIVLLASEHPALDDQASFDTIVVREVEAETGWGTRSKIEAKK